MRCRRSLGAAITGILLLGAAGCDTGTPAGGSRAVAAAEHLEKQRIKIEQRRADLRARPSSRPMPPR